MSTAVKLPDLDERSKLTPLEQRELQLAKKIERIDDIEAELNKGDSWAWIRQKFERAGRNYRWFKPREAKDSLVGTRYEVMGWLHCLFGEADTARTAWEICLEQQKKADEAEAQAARLVTQIEDDRKRFGLNEATRVEQIATLTAEVKRVEAQRDEHFSEIKRAQEIIDGQVVLNRENESKIAGLIVQVEEYDALHQTLSKILTNTANELHGGPLENGMWSWHDLAELAKALRESQKKAVAELAALRDGEMVLARYVVEHPHAAFGMGDEPHLQRGKMHKMAMRILGMAETKG